MEKFEYILPYPLFLMLNFAINKFRYMSAFISPKTFVRNSSIGNEVFIWGGAVIENSYIGDYTAIRGSEYIGSSHFFDVEIGKYCTIAMNCNILSHNHRVEFTTTYSFYAGPNSPLYDKKLEHIDLITKKTVIGNDVWIGANVTIIGGVTIGDGAVIAAGSIVTKDVPPYAIMGGAPAKIIKYRFDKKIINQLLKIQWWNWTREKVIKNHSLLLNSNLKDFVGKFKN